MDNKRQITELMFHSDKGWEESEPPKDEGD